MNDFIDLIKTACLKAGAYLEKRIHTAKIVGYKKGKVDIVTNADLESQKLITDLISQKFPNHQILAEENSEQPAGSGYLWVIDPIDGTSAFASRLPTFSVSIALLKDRQLLAGGLYLAIIDDIIWAARGKGCFYQGKKQTLSRVFSLEESSIGFDPGYINRKTYFEKIAAPLSDKVRIMPIIYSQASALGLTALGILNGFIQCGHPQVWDVAAGKLLVSESGGKMSDFLGKEIDLFNLSGYVAGNSHIHKQLLKYV